MPSTQSSAADIIDSRAVSDLIDASVYTLFSGEILKVGNVILFLNVRIEKHKLDCLIMFKSIIYVIISCVF